MDIHRFLRQLRRLGLSLKDPRLAEIEQNIEICQNQIIDSDGKDELVIDLDCFKQSLKLFAAEINAGKILVLILDISIFKRNLDFSIKFEFLE